MLCPVARRPVLWPDKEVYSVHKLYIYIFKVLTIKGNNLELSLKLLTDFHSIAPFKRASISSCPVPTNISNGQQSGQQENYLLCNGRYYARMTDIISLYQFGYRNDQSYFSFSQESHYIMSINSRLNYEKKNHSVYSGSRGTNITRDGSIGKSSCAP